MKVKQFIRENREVLDAKIEKRRNYGREHNPIQPVQLTDSDRHDWILNDPSLYCWAQGEGGETVNTYTPEEVARFRKYGDVTPNGVAFDWWLVSAAGAGFCVIREPQHTKADIAEACAYLRRDRDVVGRIRLGKAVQS